jgi:hypothetical protein
MPADADLGYRLLQYSAAKSAMDAAKSYLERGRRYASLSDHEIRQVFITQFRSWAHDMAQEISTQGSELNDLSSELELRKQVPPYEDLGPELASVQRIARDRAASLTEQERHQLARDLVERYKRGLDEQQ